MGGSVIGDGKGGVKTGSTATVSPEAAAAAAGHVGTASNASSSSTSKVITGVSRGQDPTTGKPITTQIYKAGYEQSYIKALPPASRIALQKKMLSAGLYPQGFKPTLDGMVTTEDFNAIQKLVAVGEQKGIGDINAVLDLSKKDKTVLNYLQTGGYAPTGTKISYTSSSESKATLTDKFLSLFNEKPTDAELKDFQTIIKSKETAAKGGLSSLEVNDVILAVANKRISAAAAGAIKGDAKAVDVLDSGLLGRRVREIRAAYYDNGIPVSDATVYKQAGASLRDQDAYNNVLEEINNNAVTQWGKLGLDLKPGQTVRTKLQPFITTRAKIRGISEDEINIADMTDVLNSDGTVKSYKQFKLEEYGSKEYLGSDNYKQVVLNDTQAVLRNFGIM
jgi:hypothetical protein